ncbi:MAG: substrate-binding domain-containing protein [Sphingomonas sp.]
MISRRRFLVGTAVAGTLPLVTGCAKPDGLIRIGFLVKQPEEQWFQDEWRFAAVAAREKSFELIRIGAEDGDRVLAAIDNLYAQYAQGFIICTPDPRLGTAIRLRAEANDLKVLSVDDRLLGPDDQPIASIPHVGISAVAIGEMAGREACEEAKRRGWDLADTGVLRIAFDSLDTGRERTQGGVQAVRAAGIPASHIFSAPQRTTDTEGGFTAADPILTQQQSIHHWIVLGLNDETVLGGVRAAEGLGLARDAVIGVGIGGSGSATAEFAKPQPTGFHASILLSPRRHGYDTSVMMYDWIVHGTRPPLVTSTTGTLITRENYKRVLAAEAA